MQRETQRRAQAAQREVIMNMLTTHPEMEKVIKRLQSNPALLDTIIDPSVLLAIEMGDIQSLMNNPHIRELLSTETIEMLNNRAQQR